MIYRKYEPNKHLWNGLGGKIESNESPLESIHREMKEEADIDLNLAEKVHYTGIVTWIMPEIDDQMGMYVFFAYFSDGMNLFDKDCEISEGILSWKPLEWVCNKNNNQVVSNIPIFLPPMLELGIPKEYYFKYKEKLQLLDFMIKPLSVRAKM